MQEILDYLYGLERFGMKLGLEEITATLNTLNNPQNHFKSIHIAGTNGKGSTACFLANILQKAGYKVGLYTSPHLIKFNERIKINNQDITDQEIVNLTTLIKEKTEQNNLQPTFFEFTTALAFLNFANNKVDYAVIETGMGGRLDATNVLRPEVAVITNISLDHTKHLGDTKEEIAREKAGIIKEGIKVVLGEKDPRLIEIFRKTTQERNSELYMVRKNNFKIKMLGEHQQENASTAFLAANLLGISEEIIKEGLLTAFWPGRLEIISEKPLIIVDGAHNVAGMNTLRKFVETLPNRNTLVLGIAEDKEIVEMTKLIAPLFENVIITQGNFKPAKTSVIAQEVRKYVPIKKIKEIANVQEAIRSLVIKKDETVLITGSLYMVGDVLANRNLFDKLFK